jgi:hypothetical protein
VTQNLEQVDIPAGQTEGSGGRARRPTGTPPRRRRRRRSVWMLPLAAIAAAFLVYQTPPYLSLNPSRSRIPLHFPFHYWLIVGHVAFGTVSLVTLVLQLWPWLRRRHPAVHRWSGRAYVFAGALPSAAFAIAMLPVSYPAGRIGVAMSATLWSVSAVLGWIRLRQHRYGAHRRWMLYSFAIVWGQVIWGFLIGNAWFWWSPWAATVNPDHVVEAARWVGWVVNLMAVQWWLERTAGRTLELPPGRVELPLPRRS